MADNSTVSGGSNSSSSNSSSSSNNNTFAAQAVQLLPLLRRCVFLPTVLIGALMCAAILATLVARRRRLLTSQLDKVFALLIIVIEVWAVSTAIRFILDEDPNLITDGYSRADAATSYICYLWLITTNIMLAVSRYFAFKEKSQESVRNYFGGMIAFSLLISLALIWICFAMPTLPIRFGVEVATSQASNRTKLGVGLVILIAIFSVVAIYANTYRMISRRLAEVWPSRLDLRIRLLLQKKAIKTCAIMGASSVLSYLPVTIALLLSLVLRDGSQDIPFWLWGFLTELAFLDCVLSPVMMLVFMPSIRRSVFSVLQISKSESGSDGFPRSDELDDIELERAL
ncbi:hypothetical protein HDU84_004765 [Entophlyctis sp. JEL0112]|nr:hypothetical protein HDU84_004765 [Entophlyctis sp. JEL0112]